MNRSVWMRLGVAVATVAIATGARLLLQPWAGDRLPFMLFFVPVLLSAWYGGIWSGLVSLGLSCIAIFYFLNQIAGDGVIASVSWLGLVLFILSGGLIAVICEAMHRGRRRLEEQVKLVVEEHERWAVTVASIGDAVIVTDTDRRITFLNRSAEALTGWDNASAQGQMLTDVFRVELEATGQVAPDPVRQALETRQVVALAEPAVLVSKSGQRRAVDDSAAPIMDQAGTLRGCVLVFRDVSAERQAENSLRGSEERFRVMADSAPVLIWVSNTDGHCSFVNKPWLEFTGRTLESQLGQGWSEGIHPEDRSGTCETYHTAIRARTSFSLEYLLQRHDGEYRWIFDQGTPMFSETGEVTGFIGSCIDITHQKEAELALVQSNRAKDEALALLQDSEEKFRLMSDSIPQLAWMAHPDGYVFWYNQRWYDFTGSTFEEMTGDGWEKVHDPAELPRVKASWKRALTVGQPWDETFPLRRYDGVLVWHLTRAMPLKDSEGNVLRWLGTNTDITQRRRTEESLKFLADVSEVLSGVADYEGTLQAISRLAADRFADCCGIDMLQPDGTIRRVALSNYDADLQTEATKIYETAHPLHTDTYGAGLVLRTAQSQLIERIDDDFLQSVAKSPEHLAFLQRIPFNSYICVPLKSQGKVFGSISFSMSRPGRYFDQHDLQVAEDLAHRATIAIENARLYEEIREADRRKDEFLAMLGHELRNPLAPIRSGLDILTMDNPEQSELLEVMQEQVQHLARLVDDLLDVSRIVRGKIELRPEKVDLCSVVRQVVRSADGGIRAQSQELRLDLPDSPVWITADAVRISQVLGNLLNNASKYTQSKGTIWLTVRDQGEQAELRVQDNGIGIEADLLPKVFDLFSQSPRSLDRSQGGLGLGLTLVKNMIEMHRGTVSARSDGAGSGSEFIVCLPTTSPPAETMDMHCEPMESEAYRILVVDDSVGGAMMFAKLLSKLDAHEVETVHDGLQVEEAVQAFRPDIIFLDIGLPGMDGYQVARNLRSNPVNDSILLVALTGYGQEEDRRRSYESGFDEHLVKPPSLDEIRRILAHPKVSAGA